MSPEVMKRTIPVLALVLAACAPGHAYEVRRAGAALDLVAACSEPTRAPLTDPAYEELDWLCDPTAIRGRSVEQLREDAARVRAILSGDSTMTGQVGE